MSRRGDNTALHKRLIDEIGRCELCGSKRGLEVHHIVPKVMTIRGVDMDNEDNLLVVCSTCHSKLTPRKFLTQIGVRKAMGVSTIQFAFYERVGELINSNHCSGVDIMDAFDEICTEYIGGKV